MPRACAAPDDRSMQRPVQAAGPRSLILTMTEWRPVETLTRVPNGSVRDAAIIPLGLKASPLAVRPPFVTALSTVIGRRAG